MSKNNGKITLTENKYNIQPNMIKKLKILDWERLKKATWYNNAMKEGKWYCHLEGVGKGFYVIVLMNFGLVLMKRITK